jgi:hypothetical protein
MGFIGYTREREHVEAWDALQRAVPFSLVSPGLYASLDDSDYGRYYATGLRYNLYPKAQSTSAVICYASKLSTCCGVLEFGSFPSNDFLSKWIPKEFWTTLFTEVLRDAITKNQVNTVLATVRPDSSQEHMVSILEAMGFERKLFTINPKTDNLIALYILTLDDPLDIQDALVARELAVV